MSAGMRSVRSLAIFLLVVALLAGAAVGVQRLRKVQAGAALPAAPARQGDFLVIIRCRGELKATRSVQIYTPMVPGLRIAWLAPSGEPVKSGDSIIKFDSSQASQQLLQKEAQLRSAQASVDQAVAQALITSEQDRTDLADAKFTVERARLEASKQDIVSRIQGEQAKVDLGIAEQRLKAQAATVDLHDVSNKSRIASLTRVRDQAKADVDITRARIAQMEIKSPLDGILTLNSNYQMGGLDAKPYKIGDNVWAGMVLGEIPDLSTLEIEGKIEEIDRGRIALSQDVRVRVDSLPELTLPAKVGAVSPLAELSYEFPPTRSFRAHASILKPDPRMRPGMNGGMDIIVNRIPNAISIPTKALFTRAGKPIVYLADNGVYTPSQVEVLARNPDEIAISGIKPGSMVTLVDAEKKDQKK
jgi:multidrug efflux pump subunit AcrA (membrane-fusion protein)